MQNPICKNLLLTNNVNNFQKTIATCTGLSACHKVVLTVLKTTVPKGHPKEITYRDYKQLHSSKFKRELKKCSYKRKY